MASEGISSTLQTSRECLLRSTLTSMSQLVSFLAIHPQWQFFSVGKTSECSRHVRDCELSFRPIIIHGIALEALWNHKDTPLDNHFSCSRNNHHQLIYCNYHFHPMQGPKDSVGPFAVSKCMLESSSPGVHWLFSRM